MGSTKLSDLTRYLIKRANRQKFTQKQLFQLLRSHLRGTMELFLRTGRQAVVKHTLWWAGRVTRKVSCRMCSITFLTLLIQLSGIADRSKRMESRQRNKRIRCRYSLDASLLRYTTKISEIYFVSFCLFLVGSIEFYLIKSCFFV